MAHPLIISERRLAAHRSVFEALSSLVEASPDNGEGGTWHRRSCHADEIREDYLEWAAEGCSVMMEACVRDAARAIVRWSEEDCPMPKEEV